MAAEPWISLDQVAQHLGVAKDTVYLWRESRRLPEYRVERLWKLKLYKVDEWVRAGGAGDHKASEFADTA